MQRYVFPQAVLLICLVSAAAASVPEITDVCMVRAEVVCVTMVCGQVVPGSRIPYTEQPGDQVLEQESFRWVFRNGEPIGNLITRDADTLMTFESVEGVMVEGAWADEPGHYTLSSPDDPAYATPRHPEAVHRKTRPTDVALTPWWVWDGPLEHKVYLRLAAPLVEGARYVLSFAEDVFPASEFLFAPATLVSEAVHVSQIGFRPDDPAKVAFLSCWMGDGGPLEYPEGLPFRVVDHVTGATVHVGSTVLTVAADTPEDPYGRNYSGTDVFIMDLSDLSTPGVYRLVVDGIGCSLPFRVADEVWRDAFRVSARGFYHQRSGIPIGPPYSTFERPRPFHPDDGVEVFASTTRLMDTGNGLNEADTNFANLMAGKTDETVPDAWGGYMDAGDWDRRTQHLEATILLLELAEFAPGFFGELDLNIPESGSGLPDIVEEALFNLDFYHRLQTPEGGIRGGVESSEHPRYGETSWEESNTVMAYAPGEWSSYLYAGAAARVAGWLETRDPARAGVYRESALRAMEWAEERGLERPALTLGGGPWLWVPGLGLLALGLTWLLRPRRIAARARAMAPGFLALAGGALLLVSMAAGTDRMDNHHSVNDARNYAAAELFSLTGAARWHDIFVATTALNTPDAELYVGKQHEQRHAAWVYANSAHPHMDEGLRSNCRAALLREADRRLDTQAGTGFRWTKQPYMPAMGGAFSAPDAVTLVRAHRLTGDAKYLRGAVLACQSGAGANPLNLCYTTGVGHRWPRNPLHVDARMTGQDAPEGLTLLGPVDPVFGAEAFPDQQATVTDLVHPPIQEWPAIEAYWDVFWFPFACEYTIHQPMAANAFVWGYLAARA